jgi:hypothetical protein
LLQKRIPDLSAHSRYLFPHSKKPEEMQSWLLVPTDDGQEGFGKRFYFSSDKEYDLDKL